MSKWTASRLRSKLLIALGLAFCVSANAQNTAVTAPPLPPDEVIRNLQQHNAQRAAALTGFTGTRNYRLDYQGVGGEHVAEMTVSVIYTAPNTKQFTVESEKGSKALIDHVLKKLLESEQEADNQNQHQMALSVENYSFSFAGYEDSPQGGRYIFDLTPKTDNKFLYNGKIWVDAHDFAVVRIAAEPAKNPSFWVKKTNIAHTYVHLGEFWLPMENHTESLTRLGGKAVLTIEYRDYKITSAPIVASAVRP
jgi:outer membrane lipoprotein-sorting protein